MIKKLYWQNMEDIPVLRDLLLKNEVAISSTDTICGFLGNITRDVWNNINELKEVESERPFLILIYSITRLSHFVDLEAIPEKTIRFISFCWPGPATFIFKAKNDVSSFLLSDKGTIALRCPDHEGLKRLLHDFDGLFSTSANKSGMTPPKTFDQVSTELLEKVDYIVSDTVETEQESASTLIDLSNPDYGKSFPFNIIREGAYLKDKLEEIYKHA